jgi:hypothetical protein
MSIFVYVKDISSDRKKYSYFILANELMAIPDKRITLQGRCQGFFFFFVYYIIALFFTLV